MAFADPAFTTPIENNPFIPKSFFERERSIHYDKPSYHAHRSVNREQNNLRSRVSRSFQNSHSHVFYERTVNKNVQAKDGNTPSKVFDYATDFWGDFDLLDPNRLKVVTELAKGIQHDNQVRQTRNELHKKAPPRLEISQEVLDYALDPMGDFDVSDINHLKAVNDLVKVIPREKHIIQPSSPRHIEKKDHEYYFEKEFSSHDERPTLKEKVVQAWQQINTVQKVFGKAEDIIHKGTQPFDIDTLESKLAIDAANTLHDSLQHIATRYESRIRGFTDSTVYLVNSYHWLASKLTNSEHSSQEFLSQNLLGPVGDPEFAADYYFFKYAGDLVYTEALFFAAAPLVTAVKPAITELKPLLKIFEFNKSSALTNAVSANLTAGPLFNNTSLGARLAGACGRGANQFIPAGAGGALPHIHHVAPYKNAAKRTFDQAATVISKDIQANGPLLKQIPALLGAVKQLETETISSQTFLHKVFHLIAQNKGSLQAALKTSLDTAQTLAFFGETAPAANTAIKQMNISDISSQAVISDYLKVIDHIDQPRDCMQAYGEFLYRTEMRAFLKDLTLSQEATQVLMESVPKQSEFKMEMLQDIVAQAATIERTISYCDRYQPSTWVRQKLLSRALPVDKYLIFSTDEERAIDASTFLPIFEHYQLDLNSNWNKARIPRSGKIAPKYLAAILEQLQAIHHDVQSRPDISEEARKALFIHLIKEQIKQPLLANPLISMCKWYTYWEKESLLFEKEIQTSILTPPQQLAETIKNFKATCKLQKDLQFNHFRESEAIKNKKSLVYWDLEKIATKTFPLIGQGIPLGDHKLGEANFKEVVKFDEICGEAYVEGLKKWAPTTFAKVHYKLNGDYHIVPFDPNSQPACNWEQHNGK